MNPASETLFFPYDKGLLPRPNGDCKVLFLNAENHPLLKRLTSPVLVQPRYDRARTLIDCGYEVIPNPPSSGNFDTVWILPSKDIAETHYLLATALRAVKTGGTILAAAANDAGGKR